MSNLADPYEQSQASRLALLVKWGLPSCIIFTLCYAAVGFLTNLPQLYLLSAIVFLTIVPLQITRALAPTNQSLAALVIYGAGLFDMGAIALSAPEILPVISTSMPLLLLIVQPYLPAHLFQRTIIVTTLITLAYMITASFVRIFPPIPAGAAATINIVFVPTLMSLCGLMLWQNTGQILGLLADLRSAYERVQRANEGLETKVAEQTHDLRAALTDVERRAADQARLLAEVEAQRSAILEMSVPLLPIRDDTLVMPLVGALDSARMQQAQELALERISRRRTRHLIIDVTGVLVIDTQVASATISLARAVRLLGATVLLVGLRPEVAQSIIGLGVDLSDLRTYSDLQGAIVAISGSTVPTSAGARPRT